MKIISRGKSYSADDGRRSLSPNRPSRVLRVASDSTGTTGSVTPPSSKMPASGSSGSAVGCLKKPLESPKKIKKRGF